MPTTRCAFVTARECDAMAVSEISRQLAGDTWQPGVVDKQRLSVVSSWLRSCVLATHGGAHAWRRKTASFGQSDAVGAITGLGSATRMATTNAAALAVHRRHRHRDHG